MEGEQDKDQTEPYSQTLPAGDQTNLSSDGAPTRQPRVHLRTKGDPDIDEGMDVPMHRTGDRLFDRFVLKKKLGQGGMGVVWQAFDERLEIDVALKVLPDKFRYNSGALGQLKHEAKKSIQLTHSRIVRIYDFLVDDDLAALSMELVKGDTLAARRVEQPDQRFEVDEIRDWTREMGEALEYAHNEAEIVHRDLKPSNIMVDVQGRIKVADFGISRSLNGVSTIPLLKGMVTGTLAYMGPQQLRGAPPAVQDDLYSFGAMVYELLTGKPPFYGGNLTTQIETSVAPKMEYRRHELKADGERIPEEWEEVVEACLSKDLSVRPASIEEVMNRLGLVDHETLEPATERKGVGRWIAAGAVGLLLVLMGIVLPSLTPNTDTDDADSIGIASVTSITTAAGFTNSLGMQFVGIPGLTNVLFGVHEVTVGDFTKFVDEEGHDADTGMYRLIATQADLEAHAEETGIDPDSVDINGPRPYFGQLGGWKDPGFEQSETHPVVGMSRDDALAFCAWLTTHEQTGGSLSKDEEYALPTDYQWSVAAGLVQEDPAATPRQRHSRALSSERGSFRLFPWGEWGNPVNECGNYRGAADGAANSIEVGSYPPNVHGLFDMGGNVAEWCEDDYDSSYEYGVLRGGHWNTSPELKSELAISHRNNPEWSKPYKRNTQFGFRVVLRKLVR